MVYSFGLSECNRVNFHFSYVELDSWWYKKDQAHDAVLTWTPMKSAFPDGIK